MNVFLVDDHAVLRAGLAGLIDAEEDLALVGQASNGQEALSRMAGRSVDVLVTDQSMPDMNGLELVRLVRKRYPKTRIVVLTMHEETYLFREMERAGIDGYLLKREPASQLLEAVRAVGRGERYVSEGVQSVLDAAPSHPGADYRLTPRELEVLELVVEGLTNEQIAERLFISQYTVETHRKNLFRKTGAASLAGLINFARNNGLVG